MFNVRFLIALAGLTAAITLATAQDKTTLKLGDPAPKLQTGKWIQGEPVTEFARDKVYIVEFWATWCGPCRVSIPHLNELHEKFKDKGLVVIGQDVWERDESKVPEFVKSMGSKMTYRVALDSKKDAQDKGRMAETWMEAAGQNGIPAAFLVNKEGRIAWIGHPMSLKEDLIEKVMAGTYDLTKAAAEFEAEKKKEAELSELGREFSQCMQKKDWARAEEILDKVTTLLPEENRQGLVMARLQIMKGKGDMAGTAKTALQASEANKDNAMLQNQLAWDLALMEKADADVLAAANTIATRACEASEGKDPAILDTLARVQFRQGKKDEAIKTQEKALSLAPAEMKEQFEKTLGSYKKGELPETE